MSVPASFRCSICKEWAEMKDFTDGKSFCERCWLKERITPILDPRCKDEVRWLLERMLPHYLVPVPRESLLLFSLRRMPIGYEKAPEAIRCDARLYRCPAIEWAGSVACTDWDVPRLEEQLRFAGIAILFVEVLAELHGRGRGNALARLVDAVADHKEA